MLQPFYYRGNGHRKLLEGRALHPRAVLGVVETIKTVKNKNKHRKIKNKNN
jgi:hypothetical protein